MCYSKIGLVLNILMKKKLNMIALTGYDIKKCNRIIYIGLKSSLSNVVTYKHKYSEHKT